MSLYFTYLVNLCLLVVLILTVTHSGSGMVLAFRYARNRFSCQAGVEAGRTAIIRAKKEVLCQPFSSRTKIVPL
jgi:hypothetical protein